MNKLTLTCLLALTAASFSVAPAMADQKVRESKYCMSAPMDPQCMDDKTLEMRKGMMGYTQKMAVENRSKYCKESGKGDPICGDAFTNSNFGYDPATN
jgi:hypothetical protein